jgi:hypothetical protein
VNRTEQLNSIYKMILGRVVLERCGIENENVAIERQLNDTSDTKQQDFELVKLSSLS